MWLAKRKHRSEIPAFSKISLLFWMVRDRTVHRPRTDLIRELNDHDPVSKKSPAGVRRGRRITAIVLTNLSTRAAVWRVPGGKEKAPPSPAGLPLDSGPLN